MLVNKHK